MNAHLKYARYIIVHKWFVLLACIRLARKHRQPALANGHWGAPQTTLRTSGGGRVYAFTRTQGANTVVTAVNFGDAAVNATYEGLSAPGKYTDWFDKTPVTMAAQGSIVIPAHGYRVLVR